MVVLGREVVTGTFEVGHLHEEASDEAAADVCKVVTRGKGRGDEGQLAPLHDALELLADAVGRLHRPLVDVVFKAPVLVVLWVLFGVKILVITIISFVTL